MDLPRLTAQVDSIATSVAAYVRAESGRLTAENVSEKSANNLVTHVDRTAEQRLVEALAALVPTAGFIAEEGTGQRGTGLNWVIDPLDGTTNFVHGLPGYSLSIALVDGVEPLLGVVHEVTLDERFTAWRGGGAWRNGAPIRVSARRTLRESLLATGFPYDDFAREREYLGLFRDLLHRTHGIRRLGSAAADLAYVACGRFEAFYEYGLNPWDVAAGILLVREAGGRVSAFLPGKNPLFDEEMVASNGSVHDELLALIRQYWQPAS